MAYFQRNSDSPDGYTRQFPAAPQEDAGYPEEDYEANYDDGFDQLLEDHYPGEELPEEEVLSEEEVRAVKRRKYRIAAGFGDFGATLVGMLVILVLVAFLINMIRFVSSDFTQNFSLFATKF